MMVLSLRCVCNENNGKMSSFANKSDKFQKENPLAYKQDTSEFKVTKNIIYGDRILFDCISGNIHRLNNTTSMIITELQKGANIADLIKIITVRYGIPKMRASSDLEVVLSELIALKIIEGTN